MRNADDSNSAADIQSNHHHDFLAMSDKSRIQHHQKQSEVRACASLGDCYSSQGQYEKAVQQHQKRLSLVQLMEDKEGEMFACSSLGKCYYFLGQHDKAIQHHEMSLNIAQKIGDKKGEARAHNNLGDSYRPLGQYEKKIQHDKMSLNIAKQIGDKEGEARVHSNLGDFYRSLGQYDKAMEHIEMSLDIAKQNGVKEVEASALIALGIIFRTLGKVEQAIRHVQTSLNIGKEVEDNVLKMRAYCVLGHCYHSIGLHYRALLLYEKGLSIAQWSANKDFEMIFYNNLGLCYHSLQIYHTAKEYHTMRLNYAKQTGHKTGEMGAHCNLGTCYYSMNQLDKAFEHHRMALEIAKTSGYKAIEARSYRSIGDCHYYHGKYKEAEECLRKCLQLREELFDNVPKQDDLKVSMRDKYFQSNYRRLADILLRQDRKEEALVVSEKGRARSLSELMLTSKAAIHCPEVGVTKNMDPSGIRDVVRVLGSTVLYFTFSSLKLQTWIIQTNGEILFTESGVEVLPKVKVCHFPKDSIVSLNSLIKKTRELLRSGCIVKCEDRSLSFLYPEEQNQAMAGLEVPSIEIPDDLHVAPRPENLLPTTASNKETTTKTHPGDPAEAEGWGDHQGKTGEDDFKGPLHELYKIVLAPVREFIAGSQVVVVPDGPFPMIPFAALIDEKGNYIAEDLQVRLVPSLATAQMMMMEHAPGRGSQASPLIVGDPDVREFLYENKTVSLQRLPHANEEARMIGQLLGVQPLTAERATRETVLKSLESANLIHIAAHGHMERGEILLAPNSGIDKRKLIKKEDVMLTISDLERKSLRAQLVVLSCCHSANGKIRAEGVIGIARAFLGAGARAVVMTLWAIDDAATFFFMREFYKNLKSGQRANEALHGVMKIMMQHEKFSHPFYWAPFVLIGDNVTPFSKP